MIEKHEVMDSGRSNTAPRSQGFTIVVIHLSIYRRSHLHLLGVERCISLRERVLRVRQYPNQLWITHIHAFYNHRSLEAALPVMLNDTLVWSLFSFASNPSPGALKPQVAHLDTTACGGVLEGSLEYSVKKPSLSLLPQYGLQKTASWYILSSKIGNRALPV